MHEQADEIQTLIHGNGKLCVVKKKNSKMLSSHGRFSITYSLWLIGHGAALGATILNVASL